MYPYFNWSLITLHQNCGVYRMTVVILTFMGLLMTFKSDDLAMTFNKYCRNTETQNTGRGKENIHA